MFTVKVSALTHGAGTGLMTSGVLAVLPDEALIVAVVCAFTGVVVTGNVPLL